MKGREAFVATSNPNDSTRNTLTLSGIELVIPLEADLDGDPDTPDHIRLRHLDGAYEAELSVGDPAVEPDGRNPLNYYHFFEVPIGRYAVEVKVGDQWCTVLTGLKVTPQGAFLGEVRFEAKTDGSRLGKPELDMADELPEEHAADIGYRYPN